MGVSQKIIDFFQNKFGKLAEEFLKDIKIVTRGIIVIDISNQRVYTKKAYIALVDKSTGKDIFKLYLPIEFKLQIKPIQIPWELKGEFKKKNFKIQK